jgi:hypothetical protein
VKVVEVVKVMVSAAVTAVVAASGNYSPTKVRLRISIEVKSSQELLSGIHEQGAAKKHGAIKKKDFPTFNLSKRLILANAPLQPWGPKLLAKRPVAAATWLERPTCELAKRLVAAVPWLERPTCERPVAAPGVTCTISPISLIGNKMQAQTPFIFWARLHAHLCTRSWKSPAGLGYSLSSVRHSWVCEWNGGLLAPAMEMALRILMAGAVFFGVTRVPSPPSERPYPPPLTFVLGMKPMAKSQ